MAGISEKYSAVNRICVMAIPFIFLMLLTGLLLPELIIVLYDGVSYLNAVHTAVTESLFEEDRTETRVQRLPNILQQAGLTELDGVLYEFEVVGVRVLSTHPASDLSAWLSVKSLRKGL